LKLKHSLSVIIGAIVSLLILYSCTYEVNPCRDSNITYDNTVARIIDTKCTIGSPCHGSNPNIPTWEDYSIVFEKRNVIDSLVFEVGSMPRTGSLDPCEYQQLRTWLDNGAPEN
jgi:hypothetical protein